MKNCKVCGKAMISSTDICPNCRLKKSKSNYIRKNATFNPNSQRHMLIWEWCQRETENFKAQSFSDFCREKLEWCMKNQGEDENGVNC